MEVPLPSQELVNKGTGAHTSQPWTMETDSWKSWETWTMEYSWEDHTNTGMT